MISVTDIAFVRHRAPDLERMAAFYEDFGLHRSGHGEDAVYLRGHGTAPYLVAIDRGDAANLGMGFHAASADDLARFAAGQNVPVQPNAAPGGGFFARVKDPCGFTIDVVHGFTPAPLLPQRTPVAGNTSAHRRRHGATVRSTVAPAQVQRLGHLVLFCADFQGMLDFYTQVLGMRISDAFYDATPENLRVAFLRCGLGEQWTDHHTIGIAQSRDGTSRFGHSAFEVSDFDDLVQGGEYLKQRGHLHSWGVGRHILGSQLFDYWRDPVSNHVEHWTDGDLVNDSVPSTFQQIGKDTMHQWGPEVPECFFAPGPALIND